MKLNPVASAVLLLLFQAKGYQKAPQSVLRSLRRKAIDTHSLQWAERLDYDAFRSEVSSLGRKLQADEGQEDIKHLNMLVSWRNCFAVLGLATMWLPANPISIVALSLWTYASWTMIAHHVCHGGYNRISTSDSQFRSNGFALGSVIRRIIDWQDWMLPEAWNLEHNRLHHYHLGEGLDPDLVERNLGFLRTLPVPKILKQLTVLSLVPVWKWVYYAPNTFRELQIQERIRSKQSLPQHLDPHYSSVTLKTVFLPMNNMERAVSQVVNPFKLLFKVLMPFFLCRFILLPLPLLIVNKGFYKNAIQNLLAAELFTNIHSFITIVTNHAGSDLYSFDDSVKPRSGSFYVRQIISSVNYNYGNNFLDFLHGWLNYQIEHHVWPDLSMLSYQKGAPQLRAICEKYGMYSSCA